MGQYHLPVCLSRREFIYPHQIGTGLKQWEQFANLISTPAVIFALLCTSNHRGGGDLAGVSYRDNKKTGVLGRWAGQPIAIIGDYSESDDLPPHAGLDDLYDYCSFLTYQDSEDKAKLKVWKKRWGTWKNITPLVLPVLEANMGVRFQTRVSGSSYAEKDPNAGFSVLD